jgi:tetratricopeptide (TPR) repeat protein
LVFVDMAGEASAANLFVDHRIMNYGAGMTRKLADRLADEVETARGTKNMQRSRSTIAILILLLTPLSGCNSESDIDQVRSLQASGRYEESLEPLRRGLEQNPDDAELHYRNGVALVQSGGPTRAFWSLRKAMEEPEWLHRAGLLLASAGLMAHNHELALEAIDRVLAEEPDDTEALLMRVKIRIAMRSQFEGALEDADRLLELDPELREARVARTVALLALARVEEAAAAIAELDLKADDESTDPRTAAQLCAVRAVFAKEKGDTDAAAKHFLECLDEFPGHAPVVDNALEFYDETGDPERSIEVLQAVLEEEPLALAYRSALAGRLRAVGRASDAERLLLKATELHEQGTVAAWVEVAGHHGALEDYTAMAAAYERAVEVADEPTQELHFVLADAFLLAERYDDALAAAEGLALPAHRHLVVGRVLFERGQTRDALEQLDASLRLWPQNAGARYYAALAAERLGDFDRAIEEYRYSIRADQGATDARYRLALLHEAEGNYQLAITAAATSGRSPMDYDAKMVAIRAASRAGLEAQLQPLLNSLRGQNPLLARALVALAEGTNARLGPAAAAEQLASASNLDLSKPGHAELLRALLMYRGSMGEAERASAALDAALAAHPDVADFHEIDGLRLELTEAPESETRVAFERALQIEPDHERALLGLARAEVAAGRVEEALSLQARAIQASPESDEPRRARAELLIAAGRPEAAERELEGLLQQHPYDAAAAASLAALRHKRGAVDDRTAELEARAARFASASSPPIGD